MLSHHARKVLPPLAKHVLVDMQSAAMLSFRLHDHVHVRVRLVDGKHHDLGRLVGLHLTVQASDQLAVIAGVGNGRGNIVDDVLVSRETNEAKNVLLKVRMKTGDVEAGLGASWDYISAAGTCRALE